MYTPYIIAIGIIIALTAYVSEQRLIQRRRTKPPAALKRWGQQALRDRAVRDWLDGLNRTETKQLEREMRAFSRRDKLELRWLTYNQLGGNETLRAKARQMSSNYLTSEWQRAKLRGDAEAHRIFTQFKNTPNRPKYRTLIIDLYTRLIEANLVTGPSLTESLRLSDRKKRRQALELIFEAAEQNHAAFNTVFKAALAAQEQSRRQRWFFWRSQPQPTADVLEIESDR